MRKPESPCGVVPGRPWWNGAVHAESQNHEVELTTLTSIHSEYLQHRKHASDHESWRRRMSCGRMPVDDANGIVPVISDQHLPGDFREVQVAHKHLPRFP